MNITELILTISENIRKIDKQQLMVTLHLTNIITKQVKKNVPSYVYDLQAIVSAELLKRGVDVSRL